MAIILNDNIDNRSPKPLDARYLNTSAAPYTSVNQVNTTIVGPYRFIGLTVNILGVEYWYKDGVLDSNLVIKSAGGNASGERIEKQYTQIGHNFVVGDAIGYDSITNRFSGATASLISPVEAIGIVDYVTGSTFVVCFHGYFSFSGTTVLDDIGQPLSAGTVYFLSRNVAGKLTAIPPSNINDIDKPMLVTFTNSECIVLNYRGALITEPTSGTTGLTVTWNSVVGKPLLVTGATSFKNVGGGQGSIYAGITGTSHNIRTIVAGIGMGITTTGNTIILNSSGGTGGTIGVPSDGTYLDGLFPFTSGTTVANAIDPINQVLKALAPTEPPNLTNINSVATFFNGKLSFGTTNAIAGYTNVTTAAGNSVVGTNGSYTIGGTRLGIGNTLSGGVLNSNVVGNIGGAGIPFENAAFSKGNRGSLNLVLNGVTISTLALNGTTGATSNANLSVSAIKKVKFNNGTPFDAFVYRTGTYSIPTSSMVNGFNYVRIQQIDGAFTSTTNYLEWIYDPNSNAITASGTSMISSMTGSKNISGVKYHTGGSALYGATYSNVYKNVYSSSVTAISFPTRTNLGAMNLMDISGAGIFGRISSSLQTLPDLNPSTPNSQNQIITISASLPINATKVLGNIGTVGQLSTNSSVLHVFSAKSFTGGAQSLTGYLMYNVSETSTIKTENFNGESFRLQDVNYITATYGQIDGGTYAWDSTQSLIGGNAQHNTGLLVFDGALMYPNSSYLTTTYGITAGNFNAVTHTPASNVNYSTATGVRNEYRKFKSTNTATQSTLTFQIANTGSQANFLTDGGTGGTPSGDNIKFEFLIKRANGDTHGWANPFASSGNPEGIAKTSVSDSGGVTTVTCTLSTTPRVSNTDIVVVRVLSSSGWTKIISNITVQNI